MSPSHEHSCRIQNIRKNQTLYPPRAELLIHLCYEIPCSMYCWSIKDSLSRYCTLLLGLLYVAKDQAGVFISSLIENYLRLGALQGKSQLVDNISECQSCFYVLHAILYMATPDVVFTKLVVVILCGNLYVFGGIIVA